MISANDLGELSRRNIPAHRVRRALVPRVVRQHRSQRIDIELQLVEGLAVLLAVGQPLRFVRGAERGELVVVLPSHPRLVSKWKRFQCGKCAVNEAAVGPSKSE